MRKLILLALLAFPSLLFSQTFSNKLPNWINNPTKSKDKLFAVGMGSSSNAEVAERKASLDASVKLAELIEPAIETHTSRIDSVLRGKKKLVEKVDIIRKTVSATLSDTRITEKHRIEEDGKYTVYILMEMPKRDIARSIVSEINKDKELYKAISKTSEYRQIAKEAAQKGN
jgi:hypothetical protein